MTLRLESKYTEAKGFLVVVSSETLDFLTFVQHSSLDNVELGQIFDWNFTRKPVFRIFPEFWTYYGNGKSFQDVLKLKMEQFEHTRLTKKLT